MLALEVFVRPPTRAILVQLHGLSEELVAVSSQCLDVDGTYLDRPEPSAARFIPKVRIAVGRANENTLSQLYNFLASLAGSKTLGRPGDEGFQQSGFGAAHGVQFANFDQPFAAKVLRNVFAGGDIG